MLGRRKWLWIALAGVAVIPILVIGVLYMFVEIRLNTVYNLPDENIVIPVDQDSIERGRRLVTVLTGCTDCHGENLEGKLLYDNPLFGQISSSNLTSGQGGIGDDYRASDWEHAIRHGVGLGGKPLIFVMSSFYYDLADEDLGAMIAYIETLPPVDNVLPPTNLGPLSRAFILIDPSSLPARILDHSKPHRDSIEPEVSAQYGEYLALACMICHGRDFAGGLNVGAGLNLTPGGDLADWTEQEFIHALRTGITPGGLPLDPDTMPWKRIGQLSDEELQAIWLFLQALPAIESEGE